MNEALSAWVETLPIARHQFTQVLQRLLNNGVLWRNESAVEAEVYDWFVRGEEALQAYLELMEISVVHDRHAQFVRVLPPGGSAAGVEVKESANTTALREQLSHEDIESLLVLRVLYEQGLRGGEVTEDGSVRQSVESFALALNNMLSRKLGATLAERKQLFRRLRRLRVVAVNLDDLDQGSCWFAIRPTITSFVTDEVLESLFADLDTSELVDTIDTDASEPLHEEAIVAADSQLVQPSINTSTPPVQEQEVVEVKPTAIETQPTLDKQTDSARVEAENTHQQSSIFD